MENQLTNNASALRLFFTDDVFLVEDKTVEVFVQAISEPVSNSPSTLATSVPETSPQVQIPSKPDHSNSNPAHIPSVKAGNTAETTVPKSFKFLGGNGKSVLILVNDTQHEVSTPEGRELLRKIVKAVDLATPDFALLNYAQYGSSTFNELEQYFKPKLVLAFGVEMTHLNLNLVWNNEIILHGNTRMIFAPNLHLLEGDAAAKRALWGHLQKIK